MWRRYKCVALEVPRLRHSLTATLQYKNIKFQVWDLGGASDLIIAYLCGCILMRNHRPDKYSARQLLARCHASPLIQTYTGHTGAATFPTPPQ